MLEGFEEGHCFFYGSVFMLIIEDVEGVCRLWVVTFDVAGVFLIALLKAPAGLLHVMHVSA